LIAQCQSAADNNVKAEKLFTGVEINQVGAMCREAMHRMD
jgi:hypothetical protein